MIIFDWDGTLCDSVGHIVRGVQSAAQEMALPVPSDEAAANIIGLGLPQAMAVLFPDVPEPRRLELIEGYSRHYIANEEDPPALFPGALETLEMLKSNGREVAVATGKSRRGLDRILDKLGLTGFFHATRCADETRSKPDPLMIQQIIVERGVAPGQVVMVGDTEYDLEMATNAGVASVGVSFGVHSVERLEAHRPVAIVDTLPQLLDLPTLSG
jgi:phosphoglycolate phosphatase